MMGVSMLSTYPDPDLDNDGRGIPIGEFRCPVDLADTPCVKRDGLGNLVYCGCLMNSLREEAVGEAFSRGLQEACLIS